MASNSKNIAELLNGDTTLTATDIANDAVTADKIATGAVIADGLGAGSVTATALGAGSVTATKLGASAVTTAKINAGAVTTAKITGNLGRRNMIRNGDMQIWQRGTPVTGTSEVTADGWSAYSTDSGVGNYGVVVTRQETSPLGEYGYYAQVAQSGTQTGINYLTFGQRIESTITKSQLTSGDKVTFSCYIRRKQNAASNLTVHVRYPSGGVDTYQSGGTLLSAYDTAIAAPYQVSFNSLALNTWVRITATFDATSAMANRGCAVFLENGGADLGVSNTNALYDTTGWQLEKGDTATAYEHLTYAEELAACQRYFFNPNYNLGGSRNDYACNYSISTGNNGWVTWIVPFHVPMRASSTFSHSLTNAKFLGAGAPANGADTWSFYVQNQGYVGRAGNNNMSTLSGGGKYQGVVGTYYVSPTGTTCSHILIGNGCKFQFKAEL
tara:strand:+ start:134 stop:1456 length:1323 start_codon:yes stop_codon:yes gene_type:complete